MKRSLDRLYLVLMRLTRRLSDNQLMIVLAILVGLLAGVATYLFEFLLHTIKYALVSWFNVAEASIPFLIYPTIGIILASLFVKYIVKDDISEGVTKVLYAMSKKNSHIKPHNTYSSIIGGAVTIGFGGSVGPEAPIVLTGAAIGSNVGGFLRLNYKQMTTLLGCGAAAAIAAIFKAPIAGVIFVFEILLFNMTMGSVIPLLISSVTATTLIFLIKGFDPILQVTGVDSFQLRNIPIYIALGLGCGFISYYFTTVNSKISEWFGRMKNQYRRWLWGGAILGVLIFIFPPLFGEGYEAFTELMHGNIDSLFNNSLFFEFKQIPWVVALYLAAILVFKVVAMAATNAAGGVGGTFAPSMFVGAFAGGLLAYVSNTMFGLDLPILNFTLVGMAGVMAGVMKAPLTSIFLIAELSNGYGLFIPLMIVTTIGYMLSYVFEPYSIYNKKLAESGKLLTHSKDQSAMVFLSLEELMETDFHPITLDTTLGDVVEIISEERRNIFPVVDSGGILLGIVQLDDLRRDLFNQKLYNTTIERYMIQPPDKILEYQQMQSIFERFEQSGAWMLPVVDKQMHYLGFISKSRVLAAYRELLKMLSDS